MAYYLIPKINSSIYQFIQLESPVDSSPNSCPEIISNSLSHYLYEIKERITNHNKQWDTYKKYTNPHEYIHTCIPHKKRSVSKYKPLSRSYFKMVEIIQLFHFFPKPSFTSTPECISFDLNVQRSKMENQSPSPSIKNKTVENRKNLSYKKYFATSTHKKDFSDSPIKTFHLAEGPGGFIEAFVRTRENPQDIYIGITLLDEKNDANIPSWKKSATFLKENPNVFIENGIDGTGNILSVANLEGCVKKYGEGSMDFITGDGGFDFSMDFNNQEVYISKLLFAQITYALFLQKEGGTFVLKIFDVFMKHTIDMIAILSAFYDKVYITKPLTSRYANSEKYLVCIGYKEPGPFREILASCFRELVAHEGDYMGRFLSIPIPYYFIQKLEEYNAIFGQRQIQNINYTISLMSNKHKQDKIDELIKTNIQKSVEWCIKYDVPYYLSNHSNIFNTGNLDNPPSRRLVIHEKKEEH